MRRRLTSWIARLAVLAGASTLLIGLTPAAYAAGGQSTPGATVVAMNVGIVKGYSTMNLALVAHTKRSTVANPSCRPQDQNLDCSAGLVLRIPAFGGLSVTGFQVHRVAVGDISCGGEEGGCGDSGAMTATVASTTPVQAQVNGIAYLVNPGNSGLPPGTEVQVQITLTENAHVRYGDLADVTVNRFVTGSSKPLIYDTTPQPVQQVVIVAH